MDEPYVANAFAPDGPALERLRVVGVQFCARRPRFGRDASRRLRPAALPLYSGPRPLRRLAV